jgi:hypothetical protein
LGDEKENDRPRPKDQSPLTEAPTERGFLSDGLSDDTGDDPTQRREVMIDAETEGVYD